LPFRAAPARECPPLARLAFPAREGVPRGVQRVAITFDRGVARWGAGDVATLVTADGEAVPSRAELSCGDADGRAFCAVLHPLATLEARTTYAVALGALADAEGRAPQPVDLTFTTSDALEGEPVRATAPI